MGRKIEKWIQGERNFNFMLNLYFFNVKLNFLKNIYLFLERGMEGEGNINVWLPLVRPLLGTWPATQACALTGNQTSNLSVHRPVLNPLSHTSQSDSMCFFNCDLFCIHSIAFLSLFTFFICFLVMFHISLHAASHHFEIRQELSIHC